MIGSVWGPLVVGAVVALLSLAALWVLTVRVRAASHVDVAWALLIACCAAIYGVLADGSTSQRILAAVLGVVWGVRLGLYLLFNRVLGKEEDGRYQALRRKWGEHANRNLFWFFELQAVFVVFFSLPFALVAQDSSSKVAVLAWIGVGVWAVGNAGAITADRQLSTWRANPANRGQTARTGLWSWSRHPNYFFEWVTWCGVALVATTAPWGWVPGSSRSSSCSSSSG